MKNKNEPLRFLPGHCYFCFVICVFRYLFFRSRKRVLR